MRNVAWLLAAAATLAAATTPCGPRIAEYPPVSLNGTAPPKEMPEYMFEGYTRCGAVETFDFYIDESQEGKGGSCGIRALAKPSLGCTAFNVWHRVSH